MLTSPSLNVRPGEFSKLVGLTTRFCLAFLGSVSHSPMSYLQQDRKSTLGQEEPESWEGLYGSCSSLSAVVPKPCIAVGLWEALISSWTQAGHDRWKEGLSCTMAHMTFSSNKHPIPREPAKILFAWFLHTAVNFPLSHLL